jgi:hypothetical protein
VRTRVFSQSSRCQARHIPEMECAALAFMRGTFTQCAACELNVPGVRMYLCVALGMYPFLSCASPLAAISRQLARGGAIPALLGKVYSPSVLSQLV